MKRAAIFAHFDAQNEVKPYIIQHLRALATVCERIVFVSTSALPVSAQQLVKAHAQQVVLMENAGMDFGMWRQGMGCLDLEGIDELVLTNSSVLGPLTPLAALFDQMAHRDCDGWGLTDNHEYNWHLQSYFLVFRKPALRSPAFASFWTSVLPYKDKGQVIRSYELGLTTFLCENGLRLQAMFSTEDLFPGAVPLARKELIRATGNTTSACPLALLERGMPYVKVELLRENPCAVDLEPIYTGMHALGYDLALVQFDR